MGYSMGIINKTHVGWLVGSVRLYHDDFSFFEQFSKFNSMRTSARYANESINISLFLSILGFSLLSES